MDFCPPPKYVICNMHLHYYIDCLDIEMEYSLGGGDGDGDECIDIFKCSTMPKVWHVLSHRSNYALQSMVFELSQANMQNISIDIITLPLQPA